MNMKYGIEKLWFINLARVCNMLIYINYYYIIVVIMNGVFTLFEKPLTQYFKYFSKEGWGI